MDVSMIVQRILRVFVSTIGVIISIACLLCVLFIGDPSDKSDWHAREYTVYVVLTISWVIGSISVWFSLSNFIRINNIIKIIFTAIIFLIFSIALFLISYNLIRSELLLMSFPISLLSAYFGGGLLLTATCRPEDP